MKRKQFIENLQLYGSDLLTWPEDIRDQALHYFNGSEESKGIVESEREFESLLLERSIDNPSSDFERRITLSAIPKTAEQQQTSFFSGIFDYLTIPKPALTLTFLLLFGFTLGFVYDTYYDTRDNAIEISEYISFDEGVYYE